ncbi:Subtilisin-like protease 3 [Colletotrichum tanaceti]|uniref:Subtilisin-like protease 3 n=1 Tax=Colletotrichum tanaceti TaxID=1306861 RepID=A0A4U6XHU8_9PEZI|nr:Subtilisin-like protease 3 [Colletotrichum tanaceti]
MLPRFHQRNPCFSFQMLSGSLLWCLASLSLNHGVLSLGQPDQPDGSRELVHESPSHLVEQPLPDTEGPAGTAPSTSATSPTPYVIVVEQSATREHIQDLENTLATNAAAGSLKAETSARTGLAVFFSADISSAQADAIKKLPGVGAVTPDSIVDEKEPPDSSEPPSPAQLPLAPRGLFGKIFGSSRSSRKSPLSEVRNPVIVTLQPTAPRELIVISQAPGSKPAEELPSFAYAAEAGEGVTIYMIDSGLDPQHPEFETMKGDTRFIYTPDSDETETDESGHGTCVASKATGRFFGTAKNANLVMVKVPTNTTKVSSLFAALVEIGSDVHNRKIEGKAVVNLSGGNDLVKKSSTWAFRLLLQTLISQDIVIVVPSDNNRMEDKKKYDKLTGQPAIFSRTMDLIVVGAVTAEGERSDYSQGTTKELTTSAPGYIRCARANSSAWINPRGTSGAAATVTGVIAVWLSQEEHSARLRVPGKLVANVKAMVKEFSYPRIKGGPPVIWNGIDSSKLGCKWRPKKKKGCPAVNPWKFEPQSPPPRPPEPKWDETVTPAGFERVYEDDKRRGHNYLEVWEVPDANPVTFLPWCLKLCEANCASVFIWRIVVWQEMRWEYDEKLYCATFASKWKHSNSLLWWHADAGVAYNKLIPEISPKLNDPVGILSDDESDKEENWSMYAS